MASSSGTGHDAATADTMPLLTIHGAALHAMAEGKPEDAAHITAIFARRLREQAALLAERQQDKERIERLTDALQAFFAEWDDETIGTYAPLDATEAKMRAALAVEEDAP